MIGEVEPGQGRDFQSFFCTAVAAVPKAIKAIGVLATFGHKTGVHDQGLSMPRRDGFGDGGLVVERDPVNVSGVPPERSSRERDYSDSYGERWRVQGA